MPRKPAFISHSREREAQIQSRMLDVLEARFRRRIAAVLDAEARDIVRGYQDLGYVPPVADTHQRDVMMVYQEIAEASARTFGRRMITQGKSQGLILETKEEGFWSRFFRALAVNWINQEGIRRRIVGVAETTRNLIIGQVANGQKEGLGVDAIARDITKRIPDISRQRGALIARTETHGAANFAAHNTAKQTGLPLVKEWVATEDARTRSIARDDAYDHVAMDRQTRDMDEPFSMPWIGGEPLLIQFPGEAGLPGGATINCRCSIVHAVKRSDTG